MVIFAKTSSVRKKQKQKKPNLQGEVGKEGDFSKYAFCYFTFECFVCSKIKPTE